MKKMGSLVLAVCLLLGCVGCDGRGTGGDLQLCSGGNCDRCRRGRGGGTGPGEFFLGGRGDGLFSPTPTDPAFNYLESRPSPEELFPVEENTEF